MAMLTSDEILSLSPPERIALIAQLWDSLEQEQLSLSIGKQAELERRLSSFDQDRGGCVSWIELKTELEQRFR